MLLHPLYGTLTTGVWTVVKPEAASAAAFAWTASGGGSVKPCAALGEPACGCASERSAARCKHQLQLGKE